MLSSFRRLSKSKVGTLIMATFFILILASFAMGDIANLGIGTQGLSSSTLAQVGDEEITDRDMSQTMERRLQQARQQNPEATYATIAGDFEALLQTMIDERTLKAFAADHGFHLSKRLIDAEISNIPVARGLDGKFSDQAYRAFLAQQRMTDAQVRELIGGELLTRILFAPLSGSARIPVGVARPYASMLLEGRQGEVATVPVAAFAAGLNPSDADLQQFYAGNRNRYMVPEQRVLRIAKIGPELVANLMPTDKEIADYYQANQATYGSREVRVLSQAVVPDRATANAIAQRAKGGTFTAAVAPAGLSAADVSVGAQTRAQFAGLAGDQVAAAAFGAASGAVVGPIQSDLGWHVVKVESIRTEGGKSLEAAKAEISAKLVDDKRKEALADIVTNVEVALADGNSFSEVVAANKLSAVQTPLITASGIARSDPSYRLPADLAPALSAGFELGADEDPVVESLPNEGGYVLVAPAQIVAAAPAPLASVRDQVRQDWINRQASERARAVAAAIAAKVARNVPMAEAVKQAGVPLPPIRPMSARRIQLNQMGPNVPAPLRMLFNLSQGKSRMVANEAEKAFAVVKLNRIIPGNAMNSPALIGQVQAEFQQALGEEYLRQFVAAARKEQGFERNDKAIAAAKARLTQ